MIISDTETPQGETSFVLWRKKEWRWVLGTARRAVPMKEYLRKLTDACRSWADGMYYGDVWVRVGASCVYVTRQMTHTYLCSGVSACKHM